jgi:hypothetical protein
VKELFADSARNHFNHQERRMTDLDSLRYPIGRFQPRSNLTSEERETLITEIEHLPADLRFVVSGLDGDQLDTPYRAGGWTVRQVIHHVADSHMQSYVRYKWAMTEENPTIKPYDEAAWAELEEARTAPVEVSLTLLEALHARWVMFFRNLTEEDFARTIDHPESGEVSLETNLQMYAWHGKHHLAHITGLAEKEGW